MTSQIHQEPWQVFVIDTCAKETSLILDLGNDPLNPFVSPSCFIDLAQDTLQIGGRESLTQYLSDPFLRVTISALDVHARYVGVRHQCLVPDDLIPFACAMSK